MEEEKGPASDGGPGARGPSGEAGGPGPGAPVPGEHRDSLPPDLDMSSYVGRYSFPDIRRRRWPAYFYVALATGCFVLWAATRAEGAVLVNGGMAAVAVGLLLVGAYHLAAAWPLAVADHEALAAAVRQVGFPVGHASAQLGWRGMRSRPTWRILLYSSEDPPRQRGLVLVDAVEGQVVDHFVEDNPEDWSGRDEA